MIKMVYFWVALIVVFLIIEALTTQLVTIWFAVGAGGALAAQFLHAPEWAQWVIFIVLSAILVAATRPIAKRMKKKIQPTNVDAMIGKTAVVLQSIDNTAGKGQAKLEGNIWSARSADGQLIQEGTHVIVRSVEGVKLIVEAIVENGK